MKKRNRVLSIVLASALTFSALFSATGAMAIPDQSISSQLSLYDFTVEYVEQPQGVDVDSPRFGWKMDSNRIGAAQAAYQIVVKDADGVVAWDSGVVASDDSIAVKYAGENELEPNTDYSYSVTVWDNQGNSATGESTFSTGIDNWDGAEWISPGETGYAVSMLRTEKEISSEKTVKSAKLYMAALGIYKAYINDKLVKGEIETAFDPGWVNYNDYITYQTFDVTDYLDGEKIALSAELGRGWYKGDIAGGHYRNILKGDNVGESDLALIGKLVIEYADGSQDVIATDDSWKYDNNGPIYNHDFYSDGSFDPDATTDPEHFVDGVTWGGEKYDANKEVSGWKLPGFTYGEDWKDVNIVTYEGELLSNNGAAASYYNEARDQYPQPNSFLYTDINPSVQDGGTSEHVLGEVVVDRYVDFTKDVTILPGQRLIVNLGQNIAGVLETEMEATSGTTVVFSHVEMLNDGNENPNFEDPSQAGSTGPKGTIYTENLRGEKTAVYTFGKNQQVTYRPDFTFFGFQYVQITATKPVTIKNVVGKPITSILKQTGEIQTNIPELNKLVSNVMWSQMDNYLSVPTDCPQRDERLGWSGDAQLFAGTAVFNFDSVSFLQNYIDISDNFAANNNDMYGGVMPIAMYGGSTPNSGWSDTGIVMPWTLWQQTGDLSIVAKSFDQMDKYMDAVGANGEAYNKVNYGDWVALQACSTPYLNVMYRAYDALLMAQMAEALGDQDKVEKYNTIFAETKAFYMDKYLDAQGNILSASADNMQDDPGNDYHYSYVDNSQTAICWALKLGFYRDEAHKEYLLSKLLESIKNENSSIRPGYAEDTLAVGFLGLNVILPSLSGAGATDYAYKLLTQDQFPSWLYSVKSGATSIWERWNSYSVEDSFLNPGMNSFNHYSFGACLEWMYQEMLGISRDLENPGFKHTILAPKMDANGTITNAEGSYESYYGAIESGWTATNTGEMTSYRAVVPANTTATLYLPVSADAVSGFTNIDGVSFQGMEEYSGQMTAKFSVQAGGFSFAMIDGKLVAAVDDGFVSETASDKTILRSVLAYAEAAYNSDEFDNVIESVQASFTEALVNARAVDADLKADQASVDAAWQTLMTEIHKLGFVRGDKTSLGKLIDLSNGFYAQIDLYTPATAEPFVAQLTAAKAVFDDGDAMQQDVREAESALLDAMMALRFRADKSVLEAVLAKASSIDMAAYTAESVAAFHQANEAARIVKEDENATQAEVNDAVDGLNAAIDGLIAVEASAPAKQGAAVEGDSKLSTGNGNVKTGETAPIAAAITLLTLAGAGFALLKKKK